MMTTDRSHREASSLSFFTLLSTKSNGLKVFIMHDWKYNRMKGNFLSGQHFCFNDNHTCDGQSLNYCVIRNHTYINLLAFWINYNLRESNQINWESLQ